MRHLTVYAHVTSLSSREDSLQEDPCLLRKGKQEQFLQEEMRCSYLQVRQGAPGTQLSPHVWGSHSVKQLFWVTPQSQGVRSQARAGWSHFHGLLLMLYLGWSDVCPSLPRKSQVTFTHPIDKADPSICPVELVHTKHPLTHPSTKLSTFK